MNVYIKEIRWIDKQIEEAEVTVSDGVYSIVCFSCPCEYKIGQTLNSNINVLDINNIRLSKNSEYEVIETSKPFEYKVNGMLSHDRDTLVVGKLIISIDPEEIPKDIVGGSFIEANVDRFDIY